MIINQPKYKDFEILGIQCLCQSFDMLFKIKENLNEYFEDEIISEEVKEDSVWKYNKGAIMTSFILLHQGTEALMKSEIAKQSSLLLIENNKADWPTLPESKDKDFDEFQTISGDKLLKTYCAIVDSTKVNKAFVSLFEEIRIIRNKFVHSVPNKVVNYSFIIGKILDSFTFFFGIDKWVDILKKVYVENPLFGYYDYEAEESLFMKRLDFAKESIGIGKLNKHFSIDLKSRTYYCPRCNSELFGDFSSEVDSKWSFLYPNSGTSTRIKCLVCQKEYEVKRIKCQQDSCKGNVIINSKGYDELCLTCFYIYNDI